MLTIFECENEECRRQWDCEGSPCNSCPDCGSTGRVVADDNGVYCFDCGETIYNCICEDEK